jgi:hypothetical protein
MDRRWKVGSVSNASPTMTPTIKTYVDCDKEEQDD